MFSHRHLGSLALVLALTSACDDASKTQTKAAETKASAAKSETKANDAKANDAKASDAKANDAKVDEAKADEAKADEAKAEAAKLAAPPTAPAPANITEATKQLEAWLDDPTKPVPALLAAPGEIELAVHCGPCTDKPKPTITKSSGIEAMGKRVNELREGSAGGAWDMSGDPKCDKDCCTYPAYESEGSGNVSLEKVCMTVGTDGKPTAYTRIDAAEH